MMDLVGVLARYLVDEPGRVSVRERTAGETRVVELSVARSDRGRVIGRGGRTAAALRTIVDAVAARRGEPWTLEIRE